jgi:peptide-methionine (S)-S-oxide reductase
MKENELEKATFAAGCFWGVEAAFRQIPGVVATRVGYTGGHTENPTYERVCSHTTGHAEAVEVTFDPDRVSYEQLLNVFWTKHNPTTKNRQGLDIGDQYRSAIFFHSPEQQEAAERTKKAEQAKVHWPKKIVTEIVPASEFYEAEDYHQQYLEKRGRSSCTVELANAQAAS